MISTIYPVSNLFHILYWILSMHDIHYISSLLPFSYPLLDSQYAWYPLYIQFITFFISSTGFSVWMISTIYPVYYLFQILYWILSIHDFHYISSLLPFSYPLLGSQYGWYPLYEAFSPNILDRLLYHAVPVEKNIRCLNKIVVFLFYMMKIINIGNNMFFVDSKKPIYARVDLFNLNDLRLTTKAPVSLLSSVI